MKTAYTLSEIENFLASRMTILPGSLEQLTEGHSSQVFAFTSDDKRLVIRIRGDEQDLLADKYAYEHFDNGLPIPKVLQIDRYNDKSFFCISEFIEGLTTFSLDRNEFSEMLPAILDIFANTFYVDITRTSGYGDINVITGEGKYPSYKAFLESELEILGIERLHKYAETISLDNKYIDDLVGQFENNLPYVSEVRRLTHGDPGGDNMIVKDGAIKGIIDWEQMAYADWMRDFSRLEYYGDDRYGDAAGFAVQYMLESENLPQRKAVYWAINALRDVEFAATQNSKQVVQRLRRDIKQKILL
jgi:aminoglycoside phosphotransferase (APT) family kinase protein